MCICVCMLCVSVCLSVCVHECVYVCMHICVYACMCGGQRLASSSVLLSIYLELTKFARLAGQQAPGSLSLPPTAGVRGAYCYAWLCSRRRFRTSCFCSEHFTQIAIFQPGNISVLFFTPCILFLSAFFVLGQSVLLLKMLHLISSLVIAVLVLIHMMPLVPSI